MVEDQTANVLHDPVDPGKLAVYELPDSEDASGDPPAESFNFSEVRAHNPAGVQWDFDVEIEFKPERGGKVVDLDSLRLYLLSFETARTTEEAMAQAIRSDLLEVLDVEDLYVEVTRSDRGVKQVRLGKPKA